MVAYLILRYGDFMNYSHFGELLKEIRTSYNITLEELAKGICSIRQLSRIENGNSNPSLYILHNISKKLNIDLQKYYRIYFSSKSFIAHDFKSKLTILISNADLQELRELISKIENMDEFKEDENRQYILYGKAICNTHIDKDYHQSIEYCIEGLGIEDPDFSIDLIKSKLYSKIGLTILNLLASNYNRIGEKQKSFDIIESIFLVLDNHISNVSLNMYGSLDFEKKLYQSTAYNLSVLYMNKLDYNKSLEYVDKGIVFSKNENYMRFFPELLAQKSRLLFKMGFKDDSYSSFQDCLGFYRVCRKEEDIKKLEKEIEDTFLHSQ